MNTPNLMWKLAGISLVALAAASSALTACSGDNSNGNPAPTVNDSGSATDSTMMMGDDSSMGADGNSGSSSGGSGDSSGGMDVVMIDTGGCVSDAANCNSCYTTVQQGQDPYNACSPYTVNCTPFKNSTRITGLTADGGVPAVP